MDIRKIAVGLMVLAGASGVMAWDIVTDAAVLQDVLAYALFVAFGTLVFTWMCVDKQNKPVSKRRNKY